MKKALLCTIASVILIVGTCVCTFALDEIRYEYKLLRLGSLSALQKEDAAEAKHSEIEKTLNEAGQEGWDMVSIFAVRTTFDPNVFFAVMKRPMADHSREGEGL